MEESQSHSQGTWPTPSRFQARSVGGSATRAAVHHPHPPPHHLASRVPPTHASGPWMESPPPFAASPLAPMSSAPAPSAAAHSTMMMRRAGHEHRSPPAQRGFFGQLIQPSPNYLKRGHVTRGFPSTDTRHASSPNPNPATTTATTTAMRGGSRHDLVVRGHGGNGSSPYRRYRDVTVAGGDSEIKPQIEDDGSATPDQASTAGSPTSGGEPIVDTTDSSSTTMPGEGGSGTAPSGGGGGGMPGEGGSGTAPSGGGMPGEGGGGIYPGDDVVYPTYPDYEPISYDEGGSPDMEHADDASVERDLINGLRDLMAMGRGVIRRVIRPFYSGFDYIFTRLQNSVFAFFILLLPIIVDSVYFSDGTAKDVKDTYNRAAKPMWALSAQFLTIIMIFSDIAFGMQGFRILKGLAPAERTQDHRRGVTALILYVVLILSVPIFINAFVQQNFQAAFGYMILYTVLFYNLYKRFKYLDSGTEKPMKWILVFNVYLTLLMGFISQQNDAIGA